MSEEEVEGLDEEFLFHLNRGSDLLGRGDLEPARAALARARDLQPRNPRALGLLGQALYKLGRYEEAVHAYGQLVEESPDEAAARLNLGLAALKAKRFDQAVAQLGFALELNPDHKKAMRYLGLAWLEQGDIGRAREWFERSGSEQMLARCDEVAVGKPGVGPADEADADADADVTEALPLAQGLAAFAAARRVSPPAQATTFVVASRLLHVAVRRDVVVRSEGLLSVQGAVCLVGEMKRFRGQATLKPFGDGRRRMLRASGEGTLLYRHPSARLTTLDLAGEGGYFREEAVFAFEDSVAFENGRVASRVGPDLNLVHLRGHGLVLLVSQGGIVAVDASGAAPARVPASALIGWRGALTPRLAALRDGGAKPLDAACDEPSVVDLGGGDGQVLLDDGGAA